MVMFLHAISSCRNSPGIPPAFSQYSSGIPPKVSLYSLEFSRSSAGTLYIKSAKVREIKIVLSNRTSKIWSICFTYKLNFDHF